MTPPTRPRTRPTTPPTEDTTSLLAAACEEALLRQAGAVRLLADARAARGEVADDEHDPEGPTVAFEFARAEALRISAERDLRDIHFAVARLGAGAYGRCEDCGGSIASARLRARPTATLFLPCAVRRDGI